MIDKISGSLSAGYTRESKPVPESVEVEQNKLRTSTPSVEVELSKEAQLLQKATQAAKDAPEIRADVVQGIQDQLQAGTYSVNYKKLAKQLISILA